jgi:hypothetical protein
MTQSCVACERSTLSLIGTNLHLLGSRPDVSTHYTLQWKERQDSCTFFNTLKVCKILSRCLSSTRARTLQYVNWQGMLVYPRLNCSTCKAERCQIHSVAPLKLISPAIFARDLQAEDHCQFVAFPLVVPCIRELLEGSYSQATALGSRPFPSSLGMDKGYSPCRFISSPELESPVITDMSYCVV